MGSRNRGSRRRHWGECTTRTRKIREVVHELRGSEHECATEQGHGQDRDDERPGRPHRATKHLAPKVRQPRALGLAASTIVKRGDQDSLVEVGCRARDGQRTQEAQDARAAPDLGRARGTTLDVGSQAGSVGREQVIEQEGIDELSGVRAIEDVRVRHITYMT